MTIEAETEVMQPNPKEYQESTRNWEEQVETRFSVRASEGMRQALQKLVFRLMPVSCPRLLPHCVS